jgi:hypothetical protein
MEITTRFPMQSNAAYKAALWTRRQATALELSNTLQTLTELYSSLHRCELVGIDALTMSALCETVRTTALHVAALKADLHTLDAVTATLKS